MNILRVPSIFFLFICSLSQAQVNYEKIVSQSVGLLERMVNSKPISGCEEEVAGIIENRLKELGLPYEVILSGDAPAATPAEVTDPGGKCLDGRQPSLVKRPNFVIKLKATKNPGQLKSFMVVSHIDVVPAIKQVWSPGLEPHKMTTQNGYIYGRGVLDMLGYAAFAIELFGETNKMKLPLERDLILVLNSGEEIGGAQSMGWLTKNKPELFKNVEIAISEGGAVTTDNDQRPLFIGYEAAQKRYQDFYIKATGETGHSSTPSKMQATELLQDALVKVRQLQALPRLIPIIQSYFKERAKVETDLVLKPVLETLGNAKEADTHNLYLKYKNEVSVLQTKYPVLHALLRRTCTNTVIEAGSTSAKNAQPQTATAYVNCRLMPDETVDDFFPQLKSKINFSAGTQPTDPKVEVTMDIDYRWTHGGASDINGVFPKILQKYASGYLKGVPVIPSMLTGATDLRYLRKMGIQAYGFGPVFFSDSDRKRAHGVDERIFADNLTASVEMFHNIILDIVAPSSRHPAAENERQYSGLISKDFKHAFGDSHSDHSPSCSH